MKPLSAECALSDRQCEDCSGVALRGGQLVFCEHKCHHPLLQKPKTWKQIMADAKGAK